MSSVYICQTITHQIYKQNDNTKKTFEKMGNRIKGLRHHAVFCRDGFKLSDHKNSH